MTTILHTDKIIPAETLAGLAEGDVVETVPMFPGLDKEPVIWRVLEVFDNCGAALLTFHAYYEGVLLCAAKVQLGGKEPIWSFT